MTKKNLVYVWSLRNAAADKAGEFLQSAAGQAIKSAVRQAANQFGRQLVRGLMGSLLGGSKRR